MCAYEKLSGCQHTGTSKLVSVISTPTIICYEYQVIARRLKKTCWVLTMVSSKRFLFRRW